MGIPRVNSGSTYKAVTFVDIHKDNPNTKKYEGANVYNIPIGTVIETNSHKYEVTNDGVYKSELNSDGEAVLVDKVDMTLPQMAALSVFAAGDSTGDAKTVTYSDSNAFNYKTNSAAKKINDKLERSGSDFYVKSEYSEEDGGMEYASSGDGYFVADFLKGDPVIFSDKKHFSMKLPNNNVKETAVETTDNKGQKILKKVIDNPVGRLALLFSGLIQGGAQKIAQKED